MDNIEESCLETEQTTARHERKCSRDDQNLDEKRTINKTVITIHQNKNKTLQHVPHYLIPGLNVHHIDETKEYKEISVSLPWPIYTSDVKLDAMDICHKRVKENDEYQTTLRRYHAFYNTAKKKKEYKKARKKDIYPWIVVKFAELLEKCPDSYFNSKYDWYYTGGNLCTVKNDSHSNETHIFHVTGKNLDNLVLSKITDHNDYIVQLNSLHSIQLEESHVERSSEIYEIQSKTSSLSHITCVTRQKHSISQYHHSINDEGDDVLNCDYTLKNTEVPFISFAIDQDNDTNLITSDLCKTVKIWDLKNSTDNPKQILYEPESINENEKNQNWNCIRYFKRDTYAYTDFNNFTLFDVRLPVLKKQQEFIIFKEFYNRCENIVNLLPSEYNENHLYIGTTHKLFAIDVRNLSSRKNKFVVSKWTHQMQLPPIVLKTYNNQENEIILLGSPYYEDIRLCEHKSIILTLPYSNNSKTKFYSSLPLMPLNKFDAYNTVRIEGNCLDISSSLQLRIKCCNTGLSFLDNNQKPYILQVNSIGDIFIQQLQISNELPLPNKMNFINKKWIEYENNLKIKNQNSPLNLTYMENFSSFEKVFRCKRLSQKQEKFCEKTQKETLTNNQETTAVEFDEPKRPRRLQKWQRSMNDLKQYKDALAKDILSVWDDIDFDIMMDTSKNLKKLSKIDKKENDLVSTSQDLVSDWLNKKTIDDDKSILNEDYNEIITLATIEDTSLITLDISKNMNESIPLFSEDPYLNETKLSVDYVKPKINKKRKYVMGF